MSYGTTPEQYMEIQAACETVLHLFGFMVVTVTVGAIIEHIAERLGVI